MNYELKMQRKYTILILTLVMVLTGFPVFAQVQSTDIVLNISPLYPTPNQTVNASLNSYSTDLDKAIISWSVNNQEMLSGIGKKNFSFTMGNLGSSINLTANISTLNGQNLVKTATLASAEVDLLWESSNVYAPPFYKGKVLVPSQGAFKVVAFPNLTFQGEKIKASNLSYTWAKDDKSQPRSSGWGKNYFIFQNSYLDKGNTVKVKVSDILGSINTEGTLNLQTANPKIVFYENDASFGVKWEEALSDGFAINPNGGTLVAEPYFFSPQNISSSDLSLKWFLNGEPIATPSPKNILSIKPEVGQTGTALIKIMAENAKTLFQSTEKEMSVRF